MMKGILATVFMVLSSGPLFALEPADRAIKNAYQDIIRFEQQADGLTAERKSNIRRILKLMSLSYERLQGSSRQDHPSWQETEQRYNDLRTQLESLASGQVATQTPSSKPSASADSGTAVKSKSTSPKSENAISPSSDAGKNASDTASAPASSSPSIPPLVSGQRVRVKKLARDMVSVRDAISTTGPSRLQNASEVGKAKKRFGQFRDALARYPQIDDPDVQIARAEYKTLGESLTAEFNRAKQQLAQLGNVQQRLTDIRGRASQFPVPPAMSVPFTQAQAVQWAETATQAQTVAGEDLKQLEEIIPIAYLPQNQGTPASGSPFDIQDAQAMMHQSAARSKAVNDNYLTMTNSLSRELEHVGTELSNRWQEDPTGEKKWLFMQKSQIEQLNGLVDKGISVAESARYLEQALGLDASFAKGISERFKTAREQFLHKRELALDSSLLPTAKSNDPELLAIAQSIVENPKYKFGEHGRIILTTAEIVERERKSSEVDIDDVDVSLSGDIKFSGTQTTWTYRWQEFKFATTLKHDDGWYIWWITAKNFSSGGNSTPLNRWISGTATEGNPIREENL